MAMRRDGEGGCATFGKECVARKEKLAIINFYDTCKLEVNKLVELEAEM